MAGGTLFSEVTRRLVIIPNDGKLRTLVEAALRLVEMTPAGTGWLVGATGGGRRWHRLNKPERCLHEVPEMISIGDDHTAACHFAE